MDSLQISTGEKHIEIVRDGAVTGVLTFNPNDALTAEKFYKVIEKLNAKEKELQALSKGIDSRATKDANGIPVNAQEIIDFAKQAHAALCEEYDYLFGAGTAKMIFGDFVPVNADGFQVHEQFIRGFAPHFEKARAEKINKYIPDRKKRRK